MIEKIEANLLEDKRFIIYEGNIYKLIKREVTCKKCGVVFLSDRRSAYCSKECREAYYHSDVKKEKYGEDRTCFYCKEKYTAYKYSYTICCSRVCARLLEGKIKKIQKKEVVKK